MLNLLFCLMIFGTWAATLEEITCFTQVSDVLVKLNVTQTWEQVHQTPRFSLLKSRPSKQQDFSVWLANTPDEAVLIVSKEKTFIEHTFNPGQKCQMKTFVSDKKSERTFTSLDFFEKASANLKFVIVLWSPHMAISLKELEELKGKKFSVPIIYVLDKNADETMAKAYIKKEKFPKEYLLKWNFIGQLPHSIEHYPSSLFVKEGKVVKYIPGFNGPNVMAKLIKDYL